MRNKIIEATIDKVVDESFIAFVLGTKSFDEFDEFVETLKKEVEALKDRPRRKILKEVEVDDE